jgi:hypothetical protein
MDIYSRACLSLASISELGDHDPVALLLARSGSFRKLPLVRRLLPLFAVAVLLSTGGCGGSSISDSTTQSTASSGAVEVSTCGAKAGFEFKLHKVDCEIANTLIVTLDGRALHQSVTLRAEGKRRATWVCTSPTHSLVDRLHCQQGARFFTVERMPQ